MTVFVTADLHFNHANIVEYCGRPFAGLDEMHTALIEAWNATVAATDDVWVLGDFGFDRKGCEPLERLFGALRGRKHLVVGNHDEENRIVLRLPWTSVHWLHWLRYERHRFQLCHYPLATWRGRAGGAVHLHGHLHGGGHHETAGPVPGRFDVGVDAVDGWAPRPIDEWLPR